MTTTALPPRISLRDRARGIGRPTPLPPPPPPPPRRLRTNAIEAPPAAAVADVFALVRAEGAAYHAVVGQRLTARWSATTIERAIRHLERAGVVGVFTLDDPVLRCRRRVVVLAAPVEEA
jgi:hypothetical protein